MNSRETLASFGSGSKRSTKLLRWAQQIDVILPELSDSLQFIVPDDFHQAHLRVDKLNYFEAATIIFAKLQAQAKNEKEYLNISYNWWVFYSKAIENDSIRAQYGERTGLEFRSFFHSAFKEIVPEFDGQISADDMNLAYRQSYLCWFIVILGKLLNLALIEATPDEKRLTSLIGGKKWRKMRAHN